jgi:hypothetical protein
MAHSRREGSVRGADGIRIAYRDHGGDGLDELVDVIGRFLDGSLPPDDYP